MPDVKLRKTLYKLGRFGKGNGLSANQAADAGRASRAAGDEQYSLLFCPMRARTSLFLTTRSGTA